MRPLCPYMIRLARPPGRIASSAGMGTRNFLALEKQDVGAAVKNLLVDTAVGRFKEPAALLIGAPRIADLGDLAWTSLNRIGRSVNLYPGNP